MSECLAVLDFETTGLSPDCGDRATEVAAVLIKDDKIVDRFQSLLNAGVAVPPFVTALTGITNEMVSAAPKASRVMRELAEFIEDYPLVAHNASFDRKFLDAELARIRRRRRREFACSMLLARRVLPAAPNHKLGTLVDYVGLPKADCYHRALADAEMAAHLTVALQGRLKEAYGLSIVPHRLLCQIQTTPRQRLAYCIRHFNLDD